MAKAQTQAAYQSGSAGIKPSEVMFSWNAAGTVLTVKPNAALAYAEGAQPGEVTPIAYDYFISSAAEDRAGNALAANYPAKFSTLRHINQTLPATSSLSGGYKVADNQEGPLPQMYVGCLEANEVFRSFGLSVFRVVQPPAHARGYRSVRKRVVGDVPVPPILD